MVKSSKGFRSRSRGTFTKEVRERGRPPSPASCRSSREQVIVRIEASDPHGQPHPRYQGGSAPWLRRSAGLPHRVPRWRQAQAAHREPDPPVPGLPEPRGRRACPIPSRSPR